MEERERTFTEGQRAGMGRCMAWSKRYDRQCGQLAMTGQRVCRMHGGNTAQAKRKAQLRMAELLDPATATVARIMANPQEKAADRLRAAENVFDRAGLPRGVEVNAEDAREVLRRRLWDLAREQDPTLPELLDDLPGEVEDE